MACNWPEWLKEGSAKGSWPDRPEKTSDEGAWASCDWLDWLKEGSAEGCGQAVPNGPVLEGPGQLAIGRTGSRRAVPKRRGQTGQRDQ